MISAWPLTGRDEELDRIAQLIECPTAGSSVVIAGPAGVGKTRLAREALRRASGRGRRVRWVAATKSAKVLPFGAFIGVASTFGRDPSKRVGEVADSLTAGGGPRVIIGIDDSHNLDEQSAEVVGRLVSRRLAHVVVTLRNGEPAPEAITSLWKDGHVEILELQTLSLDETTTLLEAALTGQLDTNSARRLWSFTDGNVLYLQQLIEGELTAGRVRKHGDVWVWDGDPVISPSLRDLVDSQIGQLSPQVGEVLDLLAVSEPLDTSIVRTLSAPGALEEAQARGLVTDGAGGKRQMRFGHPLFGEVRRSSLGPLRRARLSRSVATELAKRGDSDIRDTVRRAVLVVDSDGEPAVELLKRGAYCAMQLLDLTLAERLSHAALTAGGGLPAAVAHAVTLTSLGKGAQAERDLAELAAPGLSDRDRAEVGALRASITGWMFARPAPALELLDATAQSALRSGRAGAHLAIGASLHAALGHPDRAIRDATAALHTLDLPDLETTHAKISLVIALGDVGRVDDMVEVAAQAYEHAPVLTLSSPLRFIIGLLQAITLRRAGRLDELHSLSARMHQDSAGIPGSLPGVSASCRGLSELSLGHLDSAIRWLREARAQFALMGESTGQRLFCLSWLAVALATAGQPRRASESLRDLAAAVPREFPLVSVDSAMARAWLAAAEGDTRGAASVARAAADEAFSCGRPICELFSLQTATQLGDPTTVDRLSLLESELDCPRAPIAAAHAHALAAGDGAHLDDVSCRYEAMGDRVAAVDAAAQAALAYSQANRHGAALTSRERAERLATLCHRADTPALRAIAEPVHLTGRQRDVVRLATRGLSNRQIAERLGVSVRTVEGHLYRASQRAGVRTRGDLIRLLSR